MDWLDGRKLDAVHLGANPAFLTSGRVGREASMI
jgi:hypothetical protein